MPLKKHEGSKITLRLPDSMTTSDVKWLSVWCKEYSVDFASITSFPATQADPDDSSAADHTEHLTAALIPTLLGFWIFA